MDWGRATLWCLELAPIILRRATADDRPALALLAELDCQTLPSDEFLLGEVAGEPWAALAITSGVLLAHPYRATTVIAEMLRLCRPGDNAPAGPPAQSDATVAARQPRLRRRARFAVRRTPYARTAGAPNECGVKGLPRA